ncbi:MAG: DMT family transporter [Candidatus Bathyarchaeia archaeon]
MIERLNKFIGFALISIAAIIWGLNGVIVSIVPVDAIIIAFYRTFFATLILLPVILFFKRNELIKATKEWKMLLSNGIVNSLGWAFLFSSMKLIPIAISVLLNYLAPIFVAILASIILKKKK